jgi:hypothetical protein
MGLRRLRQRCSVCPTISRAGHRSGSRGLAGKPNDIGTAVYLPACCARSLTGLMGGLMEIKRVSLLVGAGGFGAFGPRKTASNRNMNTSASMALNPGSAPSPGKLVKDGRLGGQFLDMNCFQPDRQRGASQVAQGSQGSATRVSFSKFVSEFFESSNSLINDS